MMTPAMECTAADKKPGGTHSARLTGHVIARQEVTASLQDRLFELFRQYYLYADRATFDRDQAEKDWVLVLRDACGTVQGFTTLKWFEIAVWGRRLRAVFSGNTIIDRAYWGEQQLVATWCRFMAQLKKQEPSLPLYWFLVCSGYRTYLYLPLFYREFFPRYDRETPKFELALIDALGGLKFPGEYRDGVVHVTRPRECLRPEFGTPPARKRENAHVRCFLELNPDYDRGDELVCVAEFSLENTKRLAHLTAREALTEQAALQ